MVASVNSVGSSAGATVHAPSEGAGVSKEIESQRESLKDKVAGHTANGDYPQAYGAYKDYVDLVKNHYDLDSDHLQKFDNVLEEYRVRAHGA
ncbi:MULTISPECIES: hypothetical protein [Pseudomonas]|jgi:hypothetical protein|uniref:hypothetical protein n=1 Tax=Pseudomonas TaxID=286 RepID=UPI001462F7E5|nr:MULTISPECIES: hypothetical protein [Pseudomonas]NMY93911.1 hypothetical protein [Pseudomonas proteolytica]NMZ22228.1 hypothetical protein [Pseudomonas proteolytica]QJI19270.1 hypothetical protein HKK57_13635 [Pseudomonas sp. ADAK21]QJI25572.1 hypothetical protein HKK56_19450 [Pseudomonas sp. ADAK20]